MGSRLTEITAAKWILGYSTGNSGAVESATVDMAGYDGCVFYALMGTITGSGTVSMQVEGAATDTATGTDITDAVGVASTSADSSTLIIIDVKNPAYRYLSVDLTRATDTSVICGVLALRYNGRTAPSTNDTLATAVVEAAPAA